MVVLAAVATGCSRGSPKARPTNSTGTSTTTSSPATTLNKTVWFAGFQMTVKTAALTTDPGTGGKTVALTVTFTNQGPTPVRFDGLIDLGSGGSHYKFNPTTLPNVPGGSSHDDTLSFDVDDTFKLADATLTVGQPGHHQALIPLGANGRLVDLAPVTLGLSGMVSAGALKVTVNGGEVRSDVPGDHVELDQGQAALALNVDIHYTGSNSYAFGHGNLALILPNGTQVAVSSGPIEALTPDETKTNTTVRFIIPEPVNGTYQLILRDPTASGVQAAWPWTMAVNESGL
jgi:hypothetical protein